MPFHATHDISYTIRHTQDVSHTSARYGDCNTEFASQPSELEVYVVAIFGSLEELPIPEVLSMLGQRSGHLKVWDLPDDKRCDLYIDKGRLKALRINGRRVREVFEVREEMVSLISTQNGAFEFDRCSPEVMQQGVDISIQQMLLSAATAIDEIAAYRNNFADPRTRFQMLTTFDTWTDQTLARFWERAEQSLMHGASASELAESLDMNLEQVQLILYKLRSLGIIEPVREFRKQAKARTVQPFDPNDSIDRALRDAIVWDVSEEDVATEHQEDRAQDREKASQPNQQNKLIARMLKALSFGKRS